MTNLIKDIEQVLVIGATGKTGSRVCKRLSKLLSPEKVKPASLHSDICFDWQNSDTWHTALNGVSHVYLTYFPDLALPIATEHIRAFCKLALQQEVQHVTLLSGRGEPAAQECEDILIHSGLNWTVVRASWFSQNFSDGLFKSFIESGQIRLPVNQVKEPFVDIDDIAEVVVQSMVDIKHRNTLYEVTGPELLTFADIASQFTKVLGKPVYFQSITPDEFESGMSAAHVPKEVTDLLLFLFTEVLDGRNEYITDGIEQALGRKAKSFSAFIESNRACF
ncbi:NmrA family NAD(P)-binding protein [Marinomonas sp. 15G1-11]|uniref:NmrA family NAD(P)-binding protein n=1 Tax=Marinomonas phaeophyticola TaxID=3004091 RepID=A0ABT4JV66_9GAMM|nr:NmrA family NAD(P)-binding protein [Marinomonas sp. 15G1-11]MCZ2721937.1 NmrA family NAD(P)-binding protein [Marinomonas sp. 15G1-11]